MTNSLALTVEDIDQIVEAIENFVMGPTEDAELNAIWQPYIDKLLWLRAGIATVNARRSRVRRSVSGIQEDGKTRTTR